MPVKCVEFPDTFWDSPATVTFLIFLSVCEGKKHQYKEIPPDLKIRSESR